MPRTASIQVGENVTFHNIIRYKYRIICMPRHWYMPLTCHVPCTVDGIVTHGAPCPSSPVLRIKYANTTFGMHVGYLWYIAINVNIPY